MSNTTETNTKNLVIGGEFPLSPGILFNPHLFDYQNFLLNKSENKYTTYLFGGYHSLRIICGLFNQGDTILMPSYLCPTILIPFKEKKIKWKYYRIKSDLSIDLDDLDQKINEDIKGIFFINYFGFPHSTKTLNHLKQIKGRFPSLRLIEDDVQGFFSGYKTTGDICFNSFRKFLPIDGSSLNSNFPIEIESFSQKNRYFMPKLTGRFYRYLFLRYNIRLEKSFLKKFSKAESYYYSGDDQNFNALYKYLLTRFDIQKLVDSRKDNFKKLLEYFYDISLYKEIENKIVPLGFPVRIKNRDLIRSTLMSHKIFCPVHWSLPDDIDRNIFNESTALSKEILTIPISENVSQEHFNYLIKIWKKEIVQFT
jgi:hypothetical protein